MAADKDGKILAMEGDCTVDHGPYAELGDAVAQRVCQRMGSGYMIPTSIRKAGLSARTTPWGCAFRAFGSPQGEFASEVLIDELAEKVGMDPLEFRYKNATRGRHDALRDAARRDRPSRPHRQDASPLQGGHRAG